MRRKSRQNKGRDNPHTQDSETTEPMDAQPVTLYEQALAQFSANANDATELVAARPASFYQQALARQAANLDDATELVAARPASLYQQALERQAAKVDDATERAPAGYATRLYKEAMGRTNTQTPLASPDKTTDTPRTTPPTASSAPRKRSRRKFLGVFRLLADLLLLVLVLSLCCLEVATHQVQAQQMQQAGQIRQASLQYQAQTARLQAQQYLAQLQGSAKGLVSQLNHETEEWGKAHPYHDSYDGHDYLLDSGYTQVGIGSFINGDLASAQTAPDFQNVIDEAQNTLLNLHMLEADYSDHTPYNQVHTSDTILLNYYHLTQKTVLVVSSVEQTMRVYQQGKLVHAFYVTTGRPERPSLPGVWSVLDRRSPTIFESGDPPGSPYWFPDTPISYAILYHYGGFFVHDAPWRGSFGAGTQFPHQDASGNTPYNFDGSHGCINLSEADAAWVYHHTDWNTTIVIY